MRSGPTSPEEKAGRVLSSAVQRYVTHIYEQCEDCEARDCQKEATLFVQMTDAVAVYEESIPEFEYKPFQP